MQNKWCFEMNQRRKIEERLRKKEAEILYFRAQIKETEIYIQALQDVLKLLPRDGGEDTSPRTVLRPGSIVAKARELIITQGKPLHINEILAAQGREATREAKAALAGSISAYVRRGEIFTRPAPNTFGLMEMSHATVNGVIEPPDDFGETDESVDEHRF